MAGGSIGRLSVLIGGDAKPFNDALSQASANVDKFGGEVRKKFERQSSEISKIKGLQTPFNLRKQVNLDLAMESQQKTLSQKLAVERVRQQGVFGSGLSGLRAAGGGSVLGGVAAAYKGQGGLTGALGSVAGGLSMLGKAAGPVGMVVSAVVGSVAMLGKVAAGFVAKSNPATYERFMQVLDDIQAVVGERLAPVLEIVTAWWRMLADALHTMLPSGQEVSKMLIPVRESFEQLREPLTDLAYRLQPMAEFFFEALGAYLIQCADAMMVLFTAIDKVLALIRKIPGASRLIGEGSVTSSGENRALRSSFNAAAQQAQFVGLDQLGRNAIQASATQTGGKAGGTPAEQAASWLERIYGRIEEYTSRDAGRGALQGY